MSTFTYNNKSIFYQLDGDLNSSQDMIVILNGIMMSTVSWDGFVDAFSKDHTVLRYDMLDQGQSSTMDEQYTQELQVDVLYHLLKHLNQTKVHLVGISYGASVALQFSIAHGEMVDRLIIANAVATTSPWLKAIGDGWNQVGKTGDGNAYYNITIPYIYSPLFYIKNIEWMDNRKKLLVPLFSDAGFQSRMERLTISAETHNTVDQLHQISSPTLIISGEMDYLTPVYEQQIINKKIQTSDIVIIPECGHASMYEKPSLFIALVLGFIEGKPVPQIV